MKKAVIENNIALDVVSVDPATIFSAQYAARFVDVPDDIESGWIYDGNTFSEPPAAVPQEVDAAQARLALIDDGMLARIEAGIAAIADAEKKARVQVYWEYSPRINRRHPVLTEMADALGITALLDGLFIAAAKK